MKFARFFQPNRDDPMHTVTLGSENGVIKSGTSSLNQHYSRRKELESNRKHIAAYHASKIAQGHLLNRQPTTRPMRPRQTIDVVRRPVGGNLSSPASRSSGNGYRFTEPPSRKRPSGY